MRKLHKRTVLVASAIGVSTVAISISAGVVFATQDEISKSQVAQNIEQELENRMFDTIKLIPANQAHTFDKKRLSADEDKLMKISKELDAKRKDFTVQVKARLPIYGIINDMMNVSSRFTSWDSFRDKVNTAIEDINNKDWESLEDTLFDDKNRGAEKLFSKSYGVKRQDIDGSEYADKSQDTTDFEIKNSFVSFGEYVELLKDSTTSVIDQGNFIKTIVAALSMMSGDSIKSKGSGNQFDKISNTSKPSNSIVYMLQTLNKNKNKQPASQKVLDEWNTNFLPIWNKRYQSIDQFFDDSHSPISPVDKSPMALLHTDDKDVDAFENYDEKYSEEVKKATLASSLETYLDGHVTPNFKDEPSKRFITNWDFLKIFFGKGFENMIRTADTSKGLPTTLGINDVIGGGHSLDQFLLDNNGATIPGTSNPEIQNYWGAVIANIFASQDTRFPTKTTATSPATPKSLWTKLINTNKLESTFKALKDKTEEYKAEKNGINNSSFLIGIKAEELQKIVSEYKLKDGWAIKVHSLQDSNIDKTVIEDLVKSFDYDKTTKKLVPTTEYDVYDGYVFPKGGDWFLRPTDSLEIDGISFKDDSKLKPFEGEKFTTTIFKPYIRVNEDADNKISIEILWDHITGQLKGGK